MENQSAISFVLDNEIITEHFNSNELKPTTTVLNYLRHSPVHKGTKEGCAEGDCGACTVVIGELDNNNKMKYTAVDSCLVFLPMLHGKQVLTVENLTHSTANKEKVLHPVQEAMVESNGSQCGYCTPGFIMSLFALYKNENNPSKENIEDALTGNLCRCTGYKPIIEAAANACVHHGLDHFSEKEKDIEKLLLKIRDTDHGLNIKTDSQHYLQPKTLAEALQMVTEFPDALLSNGSTDLALRVTKKHELLSEIIDLSSVAELKFYKTDRQEVSIGAGFSLEEIKNSVETVLPALFDILKVFGSRQIRSLATLGGNIGSASPISDSIPVLMAYNAIIHLQSIRGKREFNINDFITGYRKTKREPNEIITKISIPLPENNCVVKSYKISKRKDLDIATVNAGFRMTSKDKRVDTIMLAYGGMAAMPKRATAAENFLKGKTWDRENAEEAAKIIYKEFSPISDARSGAEFRRVVAKNLLLKFWNETVTKSDL